MPLQRPLPLSLCFSERRYIASADFTAERQCCLVPPTAPTPVTEVCFLVRFPSAANDVPSASMATVAIDLCSLQLPVLSCESYLSLLLQLLYGCNTLQGLLDAQVT